MDLATRHCVWLKRILGVVDGTPSRQDAYPRRVVGLRRVGRLLSRHRDYEGALLFARNGVALAAEVADSANLAIFRAEETRILMLLVRHQEAVAAAMAYRVIARKIGTKAQELAACLVLISALNSNMQYATAANVAEEALGYARTLADQGEIRRLLLHRLRFAIADRKPVDAGLLAAELATIAAESGDFDGCTRALSYIDSMIDDADKSGDLAVAALIALSVRSQAALMQFVPPAIRHGMLRHAVDQISKMMTLSGPATVRELENWLATKFFQPDQEPPAELRALAQAAFAISAAQ